MSCNSNCYLPIPPRAWSRVQNNCSLFDENTYKRLNVVKLINPSFSDSLLNHLMTLPTILFKNQPFTISREKAPLTALKESRFSRYKSILLAVNALSLALISLAT